MPDVLRRPLARRDLQAIWRYIATDSVDHADATLDRIEEKLVRLAHHPGLGRARPELASGLHSFVVGNYVLFYRPAADGIILVRVLQGSRDVEAARFG